VSSKIGFCSLREGEESQEVFSHTGRSSGRQTEVERKFKTRGAKVGRKFEGFFHQPLKCEHRPRKDRAWKEKLGRGRTGEIERAGPKGRD